VIGPCGLRPLDSRLDASQAPAPRRMLGAMPKWLWVSMPVLLATAGIAWLQLRRRALSRHAMNVWFGLLLLAYVLTTASLGIFWVANQQLPAFEWHYLFGYATLLLLALHLAFNFHIVWHHLRRPHDASAQPPQAALAAGRRPFIGALGLLGTAAASGLAFVFGLRHGRTELRFDATAAVAGGAPALTMVEDFHAFSSHSRAGVLRRAPSADLGDPPPAFKRYAGAPRVTLPPAAAAARVNGLQIAALGTVLWHTAGVSERRGGIALRTSPSAGALFATELYVVASAVDRLAAGLWHYDADANALENLRSGALAVGALGLGSDHVPGDVSALVVATAVFARTAHKYRDRTYRYVLVDLGHALENLRVAAEQVGVRAELVARFDEARAAATLGVDQSQEGVLAVALLRRQQAAPTAPAHRDAAAPTWQAAAVSATDSAPLSLTEAMHQASSLRTAVPKTGAPTTPATTPAQPATRTHALPPPPTMRVDWLEVIAKRRSRRRFAGRALSLEDLSFVLAQMAQPAGLLSSAVRIDVVTPAVHGLEPGAWRYDAAAHALRLRMQHGDALRRRARAAALDQDVIGDAAAVFALSIDRATFAADASGPARGYRHALIEAGLVGERVYLAAGARGLAACAVGAFYDDEAAALVGIDPAQEWVIHFAALGVPA
jgi:SagB-type dehydrogenase family enzyme